MSAKQKSGIQARGGRSENSAPLQATQGDVQKKSGFWSPKVALGRRKSLEVIQSLTPLPIMPLPKFLSPIFKDAEMVIESNQK
jgi:hypothetical protein